MGLPRVVPRSGTKWGQNFLRDKKILKKIADFAHIENTDTVVEVGPGKGTLTEFLLEKSKKVIAVEKDERMVEFLKGKFEKERKEGKFEIVCGDVLKMSKGTSPRGTLKEFCPKGFPLTPFDTYKLVGNIPYYITGALFKKFLESENQPKSITFVVQKEVAERIIKSKKESILSISIKVYGTPEYGGTIKAGSFNPKPKVDSAIIAVRNISKENFLRCHLRKLEPKGGTLGNLEKKFFEILKAGFAHKRKLLIKNLDVNKEIFEKCGIPEKVRAEDLNVEDWICLTKNLL